jgi:hypothetical protein
MVSPLTTRPMARRPRYSLASSWVTMACSGASGSPLRRRDRLEDGVEQRRQVGVVVGHADAAHRPALTGDGRDDLEVDVLVVGIEVDEQLVHLVEHLVGAGVLAVDLVDHHDGRQVGASAFCST